MAQQQDKMYRLTAQRQLMRRAANFEELGKYVLAACAAGVGGCGWAPEKNAAINAEKDFLNALDEKGYEQLQQILPEVCACL